MSEQVIVTPSGERLVILPEAEFLAMRERLEDQEDATSIREFERRRVAGEEELIPAELVARMVDGESPVKVWREFRALTARALAEKAGLSAPYISEIESGKKEGSLSALKKIAEALDVSLDDVA